MNTGLTLIGATGLGAGLMYLLDPDKGERRRARLGDTMTTAAEALQSTSRDVAERGRTFAGTMRERDVLGRAGSLAAMVPMRKLGAELGELARDPRSFKPGFRGGQLTLRRPSGMATFAREYGWTLLGIAAGVAAVVWWARRDAGRVEVSRSIDIDAPVERVFDYWSRLENLPQFMSHVREVRPLGGGRSHWVVQGPGGVPVEWEAVTTRFEPNRVLGWRTVEGSLVDHTGSVRFKRRGDEGTRMNVTMSYRPLAGALGHGIASLFGADPESVMSEDLERFRTQMEQRRDVAAGEGRPRR